MAHVDSQCLVRTPELRTDYVHVHGDKHGKGNLVPSNEIRK